MIQALTADTIVLLAAGWLVWSFAPSGLRRRFVRKPAPAYDVALQADELGGQHPGEAECGCGDQRLH